MSSPYGPVSVPHPSAAGASIPQQQQPHIQAGYGAVGQGGYGHQPNVPYTQQGPMPYPAQQQPVQQQQLQQQHSTISQPTNNQTYQAEPVQTPPIQPQPVQAQVIQQQPIQAQSVQQQPTQAQHVQQPVQTQHVQQPAQSQPAAQQPTQTQPLQQQLAQSQPVQQDLFSQVDHEQSLQQLPIQAQPETIQAQTEPQTQIQASTVPHSVSPQLRAQPQSQIQPQPQPQPEAQQPQQKQQQQQQQSAGPPYIYDPNTTYADPNVQAWAQYYAQGGRDLAGSVYFISVPGLKDDHAPGSIQQAQHGQQQPQTYQTQSQHSETELSYGAATTHQHQEQQSQLHESQFTTQVSQYQPQQVQDQILPQPRRSQSLHGLDNPYLQQQPSVGDMEFKQQPSSPTRSTTLGLGRGGSRLSSDSIGGGGQAGIGITAASSGGPIQSTTSATPSWVLPKKTPPATVAGGSPIPALRDIGGNGLSGQYRGVSLSDPGFGS